MSNSINSPFQIFSEIISTIVSTNLDYYPLIAKMLSESVNLNRNKKNLRKSFPCTYFKFRGSFYNSENQKIQLDLLKKLILSEGSYNLKEIDYLEKLRTSCDIPEHVFIQAAGFYMEILFHPLVTDIQTDMCFKLFAACLSLAKKLLMFDPSNIFDFQNLLGVSELSLSKIEFILLEHVFDFRLEHGTVKINEVSLWLLKINTWSLISLQKKKLIKCVRGKKKFEVVPTEKIPSCELSGNSAKDSTDEESQVTRESFDKKKKSSNKYLMVKIYKRTQNIFKRIRRKRVD